MRDFDLGNLAYPVLISTSDDLTNWNHGTGFFYEKNSYIYLATAKHVLHEKDDLVRYLRLISYTKDPNITDRFEVIIDLNKFSESGYLGCHSIRDVACLKIREIRSDHLSYWLLPPVEIISHVIASISSPVNFWDGVTRTSDKVFIGNDVFVYGFPQSIGLKVKDAYFDPQRPLLKKGIVSSVYKDKGDCDKKYNNIILDCMIFHGNSGSPAIHVENIGFVDVKNSHTGLVENMMAFKHDLIGIVTAFIPYDMSVYSIEGDIGNNVKGLGNSGYTIVEPIEIFLDLIETLNKA